MGDVKWIKLTTTMFDDEKIRIIEGMPEKDTILIIWVKLLVLAGKTNANGYIYLSENIPYTDEMLSTLFNRPLNTVRMALSVFKQFGMIEADENQLIYISNWKKHQNIEGMEKIREQNRLRKQKQRENQKQIEAPAKDEITGTTEYLPCDVTGQSRDSHAIELELDKELDIYSSSCSSKENDISEVYKHFEKCGFGLLSPNLAEKIAADVELYGPQWVMKAVEEADSKGKHRYDYVKGILENWKGNGGIKLEKQTKNGGKNYGANKQRSAEQELRDNGIGLEL